ncbi:MAG: virulence protein [Bacillota bacterium]
MDKSVFELKYNVTGSERKRLAAAMGGILGGEPKYLGAPSFAYEVGCFTVDKNGAVTFDEQADSEKVQNLIERLKEQGFAATETETGNEDIGLTIEMPLEGFTDESIANLEKLISGKANLIKKAIGVNALPVERTETTLRFPWFSDCADPEVVEAYTRFVAALCDMAQNQKRVTAKEKETSNDKYAFRCFLLRLGFVGDEYKSARRILLRNLSGNSAFRAPKGGDEHE